MPARRYLIWSRSLFVEWQAGLTSAVRIFHPLARRVSVIQTWVLTPTAEPQDLVRLAKPASSEVAG